MLKGKVAVVCGAGPDIGRSNALALAANGADVAVNVHKSRDVIEKTADEIRRMGRRSKAILADIGDPKQVTEMFRQIEAELGTVDILVNNAILRFDTPFLEVQISGWENVLRTNLTGPMLCSQAVLPGMMKKGWGRIINFSGISGQRGHAFRVPIATAKMGIVGFTRSLASEVGPYGITVNAISPAGIATSRYLSKGSATYNEDNYLQSQEAQTPLRQLGKPGHIASTCIFLCSEGAGYITGQTISVSGGKYMN
jgi:NAD(P)-dependent dehydrogenase (short-subunit alcohol dehydrogenase family)